MAFVVESLAKAWRHSDAGPERSYLVTWDGTGHTSTALARNAVLSHLFNVVEDQTTGAIRDLAESPHGTPASPGALATGEVRTRYLLHGYPILSLACDEVAATFGKRYEATVRYGLPNDSAQSPAAATVGVRVAGDANASVEISRDLTASLRPREIDYAPLIGLLRRTPTTTFSDPDYSPSFPAGSVNAERTTLNGRVVVNGLRINTPNVDYTVGMSITGSYPSAAFVDALTNAAREGVTNSDAFSLGGVTYQPKELLVVSADFGARASTTERIASGSYDFDSSTSSQISVGFALGRRKSLVVETHAGANQTRKSRATGLVHAPGGVAPYFYWHSPLDPSTVTVGADQVFYVGPHDYVWRFTKDTLVGDAVVSEVEWLSIHSPFESVSFETLFGGTSL